MLLRVDEGFAGPATTSADLAFDREKSEPCIERPPTLQCRSRPAPDQEIADV